MLSAPRVQRTNLTNILRSVRLWRAAQTSFCLAAAFAVSGCVAFWPSEANRMQKDIYDIKTELNRTRDVVLANDKVMAASLRAIEQRLGPQAAYAQTETYAAPSAAPAAARLSAPVPMPTATMTKAPVAVSPPVLTPKPSGKTKELAAVAAPSAPAPQSRAPQLPRPVEAPVDIGSVVPRASGGSGSPAAVAKAVSPAIQAPVPVAAPSLGSEAKVDKTVKTGVATPDAQAEQLFESGRQLWKAEDPMGAFAKFEQIVRSDPGNPGAYEAQFWSAECLNKAGRYPDAISAYETVLRTYAGSSREADSAAKIGSCYYKMKDMTRARQALQAVLDRYPKYERTEEVKKLLELISQ